MNQPHKNKRKGFTLLEILLVIAAIGILAAIVLVAINPNRQINQARQAAINSEKNTIEKALQQFLIDTGSHPTLIDGVQRKICSNTVATPDCINIATELVPNYIASIPIGTNYTVARGNDGRAYVNTTETAANLSCPTGYIRVPGNSLYQTKDFCVMKYEAKTGSATVAATTKAADNPVVSISQTNAITACSLNGAGYGLITNAEWMTIARNIEAQNSNWRNGIIGSADASGGGLWRGHSDNNPPNALAANIDDNLSYEGTGNANETPVASRERRTHTLSNGEIIWDLSGNVWEWTDDTILGKDQPTVISTGFSWREYDTITSDGILRYDDYRPSNPDWNRSQNVGQIYSDGTITNNTRYAFLRGGSWVSTSSAGGFALYLTVTPAGTVSRFGFRCVLR